MPIAATTSATFERDVLQAEGPVLVDFWADWCAPCRTMLPVLDSIQAEHVGEITILKVNIEEQPDLAIRYQILSLPAMKLFRNGAVEVVMVGAKPKSVLKRELAAYLA
ncbi:MAG: thioredoxin [Pseudomonadota bacterium]